MPSPPRGRPWRPRALALSPTACCPARCPAQPPTPPCTTPWRASWAPQGLPRTPPPSATCPPTRRACRGPRARGGAPPRRARLLPLRGAARRHHGPAGRHALQPLLRGCAAPRVQVRNPGVGAVAGCASGPGPRARAAAGWAPGSASPAEGVPVYSLAVSPYEGALVLWQHPCATRGGGQFLASWFVIVGLCRGHVISVCQCGRLGPSTMNCMNLLRRGRGGTAPNVFASELLHGML